MPSLKTLKRICITPHVSGVGGMVSFQGKLLSGLAGQGVEVTSNLSDEPIDAVLVIGGTRNLLALRRLARRGVPIVQRLDGINWLHRRLRTGYRHWLRAEIGNWLLAYIRERIAARIIYQSKFVEDWWERVYGPGPDYKQVIHNGVDLNIFRPDVTNNPPNDRISILMVEGNLRGGHELLIESAVALTEGLQTGRNKVELVVAGQIDAELAKKWTHKANIEISWSGVIPHEQLPKLYGGTHLLFSGDLNAACPNSVIEAMACGLPVLAFNTGALSELVSEKAGRVVSYGGDPWKLDRPNIPGLVEGAKEILNNQASFRSGARSCAEEKFGLDGMVDAYLEVLGG